jgi:hypothetical protein
LGKRIGGVLDRHIFPEIGLENCLLPRDKTSHSIRKFGVA